ncbi:MAG: flap endonuclease-1 [Candidatus Thorarchaeota archaeon]
MGTRLGEIITAEVITLGDLSGRAISIDAFNTLYQFLATIRQPDGTPLMDQQRRITSHLSGLFYRTVSLLENGIQPVYVYDGESPKLKAPEVERRRAIREAAYEEWMSALAEGRTEDALKAAHASSRLTSEMIAESKTLLEALGVPFVQAPSEGEALAAQMARDGVVWASASQDSDSLLYNSPRLIRNLTISGRRRVAGSRGYKTVSPELIDLETNLRSLGISREQLVDVAILVGTDYNDRVPGMGPKTALRLIREYGRIEKIIEAKAIQIDIPIDEIREIFLKPPRMEVSSLRWGLPDTDAVCALLCDEHNFSQQRVRSSLTHLIEVMSERDTSSQSSLTDFF